MLIKIAIIVLLNIVFTIVHALLVIPDHMISTYLPTVTDSISVVSHFFSTISPSLSYAVSFTMLSNSVISYVLVYWIFTLSILPTMYGIKFLLKWFHKLKLW